MTFTETQTRRAVLCLRPGQFVVTPSIDQVATRALRYLNAGFSIHRMCYGRNGKNHLGNAPGKLFSQTCDANLWR
jgi:hypothetical protein